MSIIRFGSCENTYKLAWGRAIVELCVENPSRAVISLTLIAEKVFKYYWSQTIFFGMEKGFLEQSQNPAKEPEIVQYVKDRIGTYQQTTGRIKPELFEKISNRIEYDPVRIARTLKKDVSWRFQYLSHHDPKIYHYQRGDDDLKVISPDALSEYSDILHEAINFRWSQELERFNKGTPNICMKVRLLDRGEIKRGNLRKFDRYIELENPEKICFRCGNLIDVKNLSRDHVIPWSFLFSDDIWNIVYVHKSCNSQKGGRIPTKSEIEKLIMRNDVLLERISTGKRKLELQYAKQHRIIESLWIACGGY